jgi:hypothetical protein
MVNVKPLEECYKTVNICARETRVLLTLTNNPKPWMCLIILAAEDSSAVIIAIVYGCPCIQWNVKSRAFLADGARTVFGSNRSIGLRRKIESNSWGLVTWEVPREQISLAGGSKNTLDARRVKNGRNSDNRSTFIRNQEARGIDYLPYYCSSAAVELNRHVSFQYLSTDHKDAEKDPVFNNRCYNKIAIVQRSI